MQATYKKPLPVGRATSKNNFKFNEKKLAFRLEFVFNILITNLGSTVRFSYRNAFCKQVNKMAAKKKAAKPKPKKPAK